MTGTLFAVASAWAIGVLAVVALWPRGRSWRTDGGAILPLGLGVGLGLTAANFYAASLWSPEPLVPALLLDAVVAVAAACGIRCRPAAPAEAEAGREKERGTAWPTAVLATVFLQGALVAAVVSVRAYQIEPYSNSDGWTIWTMHARFLYRGGPEWPELLRQPLLGWTHLDYPLLLPASVARAWSWGGGESTAAAGWISALFGVATVALLTAVLARVRTWPVALAAGLTLLGTPFFVTFSSNQHADIPLGFYLLAGPAMYVLAGGAGGGAGWRALAGALAGLAAGTKNEGLLVLVAFAAVAIPWDLARGARRGAAAFVLGAAVALVPLAHFKLGLAPANDVVSGRLAERLPALFDGERHALLAATVGRDLLRFGEWGVVPFLALALPWLAPGWRRPGPGTLAAYLVPILVLGGFGVVYLLTPYDLASHLDSSLVRLLLQLWPAALLCWGLAVPRERPEAGEGAGANAAPVASAGGRIGWPVLAAVNVVLAAGVVAALGRQPAANELGAGRAGGERVRVLLGEGWYGRERHGTDRWSWSRGGSELLLRTAGKPARPVTLHLSLRGLGERNVEVRQGGRIVWRGRVGEAHTTATIAGLELGPGSNRLRFETDAPGVAEAPGPGARALTFAVYNPRIE